MPFLIDFWSPNVSPNQSKSIKNPSQNRCCFRYRFRIDFWSISGASKPWKWCSRLRGVLIFIKSPFRKCCRKYVQNHMKNTPKIMKNLLKRHPEKQSKNHMKNDTIFIQKRSRNGAKRRPMDWWNTLGFGVWSRPNACFPRKPPKIKKFRKSCLFRKQAFGLDQTPKIEATGISKGLSFRKGLFRKNTEIAQGAPVGPKAQKVTFT